MAQSQLQERLLQAARIAIDADRNMRYQDAYKQYKLAVEILLTILKRETDSSRKQNYEAKATEYLSRAEQISQAYLQRSSIEEQKAAAPPPVLNAAPPPPRKSTDPNKPNVRWSDVAGLDGAKQALKEAVILPMKHPEIFTGTRKPWRGILLYGPPGTGKSYLAKACATESDASFFNISSSDIMSKYMGDSERAVKELFQTARRNSPAVVFIDEIDSMWGSRSEGENEASRRVKTEFLVQMDGISSENQGILVLGATNLPWALDMAIRRRFERRIYIALPDRAARASMLKNLIGQTPNSISDRDLDAIAKATDGYSGSDIATFVKNALFEPVRKWQESEYFQQVQENGQTKYKPCLRKSRGSIQIDLMNIPSHSLIVPPVTTKDMKAALKKAKSTVNKADLRAYENFTKEFGDEGNQDVNNEMGTSNSENNSTCNIQ